MELTVHDVLAFHRPDRAAYDHLLSMGAPREPSRDAVALLMWLHSRACAGDEAASRVPAMVHSRADAARLVAEARAVLLGAGAAVEATASLCGADARRVRGLLVLTPADVVRRGVAEVIDGVGALVFDDRLHELMWRYEAAGGGALPPPLAGPYRSCSPSSGTPQPEEEEEEAEKEEDDGCSLFVTFSKGGPPWTHEEVEVCIAEMWGDCVERVVMEKTPPGEAPLYGRVVLCSVTAVQAILGGQSLVKLVFNGRQLWARKYVSRPPPQHYQS
ncbi:hypothetical protein QOZ80_4BG0357100 [Eleusine coracana subsp. coracana]|nr:hypothetical protein QOZ80_4BG0357100 [Eleusine coracana subsp. coracana]